jgi:hypothetical protein
MVIFSCKSTRNYFQPEIAIFAPILLHFPLKWNSIRRLTSQNATLQKHANMRVTTEFVGVTEDSVEEASPVCGRKRCGDKVRLSFSQRKKSRTPDFDFVSLEEGKASVLSLVDTVPTRSIRYHLLVKGTHAGAEYTRVNVPEKFVLYAPLAEGDEVMFALNEKTMSKINTRSCGEVNLARDSVAMVQECLQTDIIDEAESIYTLRQSVGGIPKGEMFWVFRKEIHYIKRCAEMMTMPVPL